MVDYIRLLGDCYPEAQAYIMGDQDPTVYENLIWITTPISQAELDTSPCSGSDPVYDTLIGSLITYTFQYESCNVKNRWLSFEGDKSNISNGIPAIIPWDCELVAITFVNNYHDVNTDVKIYGADSTSGNSDSLILTWPLRDVRVSSKTNLSGFTFSAGHKFGVYLKDAGRDPDRPIVTLMFKINNTNNIEISENYSGKF